MKIQATYEITADSNTVKFKSQRCQVFDSKFLLPFLAALIHSASSNNALNTREILKSLRPGYVPN